MRLLILLTMLGLLLFPLAAGAESKAYQEIGVRGGTDDSRHNLQENYNTGEIYFLQALPWGTTLGDQTTLSSRFDMGASYLNVKESGNVMLAVGADLVLGLCNGGIELEIGFRPTWMFDHTYGQDNFGGGLQFSNHVGLAVIWQPLVLSYRYQHTSNAHLYEHNPGLNLHLLGLGYRF